MAAPVVVDVKAAPAKEADAKAAAPAVAAAAVDEKGSAVADQKSTVVVVTGATGFIASHLVKQLLEAGYSVRGTATSLKPDKVASAPSERCLECTAGK
jgi:hypothetical protein